MNQKTVNILNKLNLEFYNSAGSQWNKNPNYYWEGWDKILPYIEDIEANRSGLNVLDIGCGNGRFSNFLSEKLGTNNKFNDGDNQYLGIDFSINLLGQIQKQDGFKNGFWHEHKFLEIDFLKEQIPHTQGYNLITLFGVIHHIAGQENREKLFKELGEIMRKSMKNTPNCLLIFTTWQYKDVERLSKRIVDPAIIKGLQADELDDGDNILSWIKNEERFGVFYRYSHYYKEGEIQELLDIAGLKLISSFLSDGRTGRRNKYYLATTSTSCIDGSEAFISLSN
jgi:SAM-dependent methyltransferase